MGSILPIILRSSAILPLPDRSMDSSDRAMGLGMSRTAAYAVRITAVEDDRGWAEPGVGVFHGPKPVHGPACCARLRSALRRPGGGRAARGHGGGLRAGRLCS